MILFQVRSFCSSTNVVYSGAFGGGIMEWLYDHRDDVTWGWNTMFWHHIKFKDVIHAVEFKLLFSGRIVRELSFDELVD